MTRKFSPLLFNLILFGCLCLCPRAGGVRAQSSQGAGPTTGRILLIDPGKPPGELKVIEAKGVGPINATEGMLVRRGYLLLLSPTARAAVLCSDGKKHELGPGPQGCPCVKPCTREVCGIRYDGSTIGSTRGPDTNAGLFPIVISPRKTLLLSTRPTIRWSPVAGAKQSTEYKVTIYGENMRAVWTRDVNSATTLPYPVNEAPLDRGQTYKVVVASERLSSEQDSSPGLGFTVLSEDQARAFASKQQIIKSLELPEVETEFFRANLYAASGLYSEAIEELELLYKSLKEPSVPSALGDLYSAVGLNREAEKKYLEALNLTQPGDFDGQGMLQRDLAEVYENLGNLTEALAQLDAASKAYDRLGNKAAAEALLNEEQRLREHSESQ